MKGNRGGRPRRGPIGAVAALVALAIAVATPAVAAAGGIGAEATDAATTQGQPDARASADAQAGTKPAAKRASDAEGASTSETVDAAAGQESAGDATPHAPSARNEASGAPDTAGGTQDASSGEQQIQTSKSNNTEKPPTKDDGSRSGSGTADTGSKDGKDSGRGASGSSDRTGSNDKGGSNDKTGKDHGKDHGKDDGGSVTLRITKLVEPWDGDASDRRAAGGWTFTVDPERGESRSVTTPSGGNHVATVTLTLPTGARGLRVSVTENQKDGYRVVPSGGLNAVCTTGGGNIASNTSAAGNTGFALTLPKDGTAGCTIVNKEPAPRTGLTVRKYWIVNGADPVPDGSQPQGLVAHLSIDGRSRAWNETVTGLVAGRTVDVSETTRIDLAGCRLDGSSVSTDGKGGTDGGWGHGADGGWGHGTDGGSKHDSSDDSQPIALGGDNGHGGDKGHGGPGSTPVKLHEGENVVTVTNRVTCTTGLTLNKVIDNTGGGTAVLSDFPLRAVAADGAGPVLQGVDPDPGAKGLSGTVQPGTYTLSETTTSAYTPSQWTCTGASAETTGPGTATVKVGSGAKVVCSVTNTFKAPRLSLVKKVERRGTDDRTPATAWTLSATGPQQLTRPVTGPTGSADVTWRAVPAGTYVLGESGPDGYTSAGWTCTDAEGTVTQVTLAGGEEVTCTVVNKAVKPHVTVSKQVLKGAVPWDNDKVEPGDHLTWKITVANAAGSVPFTGKAFTDDLSEILAGVTLDGGPTFATSDGVLATAWSSPVLSGTVTGLKGGQSVTVTFSGTVKAAAELAGLQWIRNVLVPAKHVECACGPDDCVTTNPLHPHLVISKTVQKLVGATWTDWNGQAVAPGDTLRWAITVRNTSGVDFEGLLFTDDLGSTADGTDFSPVAGSLSALDPVVGFAFGGRQVSASTLTGHTLGAGRSVTITYGGTVPDAATLRDRGVVALDNTVVPGPKAECSTQGECTTHNPLTGAVTVTKAVTLGGQDWNGHTVQPGDQLTWTLTVRNDSAAAYTGDVAGDDLTSTLAGTDWVPTGASFVVTPAGALTPTWDAATKTLTLRAGAPGLAAGAQATVTYTATVADAATLAQRGVEAVANVLVPTGTTTCEGGEAACRTDNDLTPLWRLSKSSDPASGQEVRPGQDVTYTLTVTNPGALPAQNLSITDDLSGVLPHVVAAPTLSASSASIGQAQVSGTNVVWTIPSLPAGSTHTLTYTVRLAPDAWDVVIRNVVTGTGRTPPETCAGEAGSEPSATTPSSGAGTSQGTGEEQCSTTHRTVPVSTLTLVKHVVDTWGGTARASDWTLTADGGEQAGDPAHPGALSGQGTVPATSVLPGTYALSETPVEDFPGDPEAYTSTGWTCRSAETEAQDEATAAGAGGSIELGEGDTVTLAAGDHVICEITNTAVAPRLTLEKRIAGLGTGGVLKYLTGTARHWLLSAVGGLTTVSGHGDITAAGSVVDHQVPAGTYTLTEAAGEGLDDPDGYTPGTWFCSADGRTGTNLASTAGGVTTVRVDLGRAVHCAVTNTERPLPTLKLVKTLTRTHAVGETTDWLLSARPGTGVGAPPGDTALSGKGGFGPVAVRPGTYALAEKAQGATPGFDASQWKDGTWGCTITNSSLQTSRTVTPEEGAITLVYGDAAVCTVVNSDYSVDLSLTKEAIDFSASVTHDTSGAPVVDAGDSFDYRLTVTDHDTLSGGEAGGDAPDVTVSDPIPAHLKVIQPLQAPAGWTATLSGADSSGYGGTLTLHSADGLKAGQAQQFTFRVSMGPGSEGNLVNTACVTSGASDADSSNDCGQVTTLTKSIQPNLSVACEADAPWVHYDIRTTNVPNADSLPVTMTWYADFDRDGVPDGGPVRVDTIAAGQSRSGSVMWPGGVYEPRTNPTTGALTRVAVGWPGWRPVRPGERPDWQSYVEDPTLPSYQWRHDMVIVVAINPTASTTVTYPAATPVCEFPRNPDVTVDKTASVTTARAGDSFTYTLAVTNRNLGAASDVTLTDPIPAGLKVTAVTPGPARSGVAARWTDCAVSGRRTGGYGGTLHCALDNVLGYGQKAPDLTLTVAVGPAVEAGSLPNTAAACWGTGGTTCARDTVTVQVPGSGTPTGPDGPTGPNTPWGGLAPTGAQADDAGLLAVILLGIGALIWSLRQAGRRRA